MKTIPSSRFRTLYAVLDEPTVVTVLGRPIGTYIPLGVDGQVPPNGRFMAASRDEKINALEDEVRQLKRELAKRQPPDFASGPVTVTSSAHLLDDDELNKVRRSRQQVIDATLAKVNKKPKAPK